MKIKILVGTALTIFLMMMVPAIPAIEYDTATEVEEKIFLEEIQNIDYDELKEMILNADIDYKELQQIFNENGGKPTFILLPLKWLAYILLKVMMLPLELVLKILVKILVLPIKLLLIPLKMILLPFRILLMRFNILFVKPLVLLIRIFTAPFKLIDLFLFILFPFRHPFRN
jgi:hypothetical protein